MRQQSVRSQTLLGSALEERTDWTQIGPHALVARVSEFCRMCGGSGRVRIFQIFMQTLLQTLLQTWAAQGMLAFGGGADNVLLECIH